MRDLTLYKKKLWRLSEASLTALQYIMVQSTPAAAGAEDASPNSLRSRVAAAHQDMSFTKKARSESLKLKEKAERERKQGEGRQPLTNFS